MKYILSFLLFISFTVTVFSQSPEKMSYQAVIRASDNSLVADANVGIKIIIRQNSTTGTIVYEETHSVSTNSNGLVSLEIGTGSVVQGSFSDIVWSSGTYYIESQTDVTGGNNYTLVAVSQLLSVPYALHAKSADHFTGTVTATRAEVIDLVASRDIATTDVNNTIACTSTSTLTLTANFSSMVIGDTINLEAHNGAILTIIAASGVSLNYTASGTANFISATGNVRFGMIRKTGDNAYIISGQ